MEKAIQGAVGSGAVGVEHIDQLLRELVQGLEPGVKRGGPGRPVTLPATCLWAGLLVCVLRGFTSQSALWRLLSSYGLWDYPRFPVGDQAVRDRLAKGKGEMEGLFHAITGVLAERLSPYAERDLAPWASEVVAIDETTLDPVARTLPALRTVKKGEDVLLPGKLSSCFDLRLQQWRKIRHQPNPKQNEKVAARELVEELPKGTLVLADLGYFGFEWFDDLTQAGKHWISRYRERTSYEVLHVFYEDEEVFDGLVWLGAYRADRAGCAVRLVEFRRGRERLSYLTNVLDPTQLPLAEIARLYARRWDVEMGFKLIKRELGLHLLWSAKTEVILQQVWAVLVIAQVFQALRKEIAARAGVSDFDVSMTLMIQAIPEFARRGEDPIQAIVERGRFMKIIRPARRIPIQTPHIPPEQMVPLPEGTALLRKPRYARRKCGPRGN